MGACNPAFGPGASVDSSASLEEEISSAASPSGGGLWTSPQRLSVIFRSLLGYCGGFGAAQGLGETQCRHIARFSSTLPAPVMAKRPHHRGGKAKPTGRGPVQRPGENIKKKPAWRKYANIAVALVALGSIVMLATLNARTSSTTLPDRSIGGGSPTKGASFTPVSQTMVVKTDRQRVATLDELLKLTPNERAEVDIARANLLVAKATPGAKDLDIDAVLETLDRWAAAVAFDTDRHLYKFHADPGNYENSEGYFRILSLITVLQQDCGVRYNPERINEPDFTNPGDLFIHGMVGGDGGTCLSMPVLYTAIARRLGYPVSLVTTKGHVFARWEDDSGERFNIEATNQGLTVHTDEHYRTWPFPITNAEIERFGFLKTLGPDESLAVFIGSMGHALADTGQHHAAIKTYYSAALLDPDNSIYAGFASQVSARSDQLERHITHRTDRRADPLAEHRRIMEMNRRNRDLLPGSNPHP